ncbi:hypothetical protein ACJRO7_003358 [Eucalyptus globulus]|uniref:Lysosomal Pro-X carboxypeptidase n=1 Tax=Eucalyptus globulus TaxID=34317 RepID=A0ABD3IWK7_EUCGL
MTLSHLSSIISFFLLTASISGQKLYTPTLSLQREGVLRDPERAVSASIADDFETFFFNQTLDRFNYRPESYTTFQQRYLIDSRYWGGANSSAPIFVYLGAESPIDRSPTGIGFLRDNAAQFQALLVYIESIPLGMSFEEAFNDTNIRGYFSSAQALADYAAIIMHVKLNLKARDSPVIVVGGSYGGMLASWFRLKYPHLTVGALALSAPILYFDDITPQDAYYSVVTKDFKEASEACYQTIGDSWSEIDRVAQEPNGTSNLSKMPLKSGDELKNYLMSLYTTAAQYDHLPRYPVTVICNGIDGANTTENGILGKIFAGVVAYEGNSTCYVNPPTNVSQTNLGWGWQYGVTPCPHWITTYYGGRMISMTLRKYDIKLILLRFGSNIIFSNGLQDSYSSAGYTTLYAYLHIFKEVLKNISDSIIAVYTEKGSHCLDILAEKQTDPDWLVMQRKVEVEIIKGWIAKYYSDLLAFKQ